ncbi:TPA: archease [Candidatus Woesearchaeota archaeon]|nr:archease [Candidatus Woesearchaeota archaeon]HIH31342.1 archease [Candidatus Woesearchaeota archaeon]HIH54597.1 archease [Candidatus Woesearchaeota archaeon]HIJ02349.1 archease [Candidatus Woesearchaeota archaeon]HIJ14173.1 archease [Candidatus Woesearchaeota archaeon]
MHKYEFFDKTADAKFKAFGYTLEESFSNALEAMNSIVFKISEIEDYEFDKEMRELVVEGTNLESLLYNFLEESIFLLSAESFVGLVENIKIKELEGGYKLKAVLKGSLSINFESSGEVKAVTYNEMHVKQNDEGLWECQVVVDL